MNKRTYIRQHAPFFFEHAGWGYDPKTQTPEQGREQGAAALAGAEYAAMRACCGYTWDVDPDMNSGDWSDEEPAYPQWRCRMTNDDGHVIASLHGIDFGRDGGPQSDPYARVVQAELALEALKGEIVMQKFYANPRETFTWPNGAVGYSPGGPFDCLGPFAKVLNCPIEGTELRRACYANGYADTFFSVPACTRIGGKYIAGFFTTRDDGLVFCVMDRHKDRLPKP